MVIKKNTYNFENMPFLMSKNAFNYLIHKKKVYILQIANANKFLDIIGSETSRSVRLSIGRSVVWWSFGQSVSLS